MNKLKHNLLIINNEIIKIDIEMVNLVYLFIYSYKQTDILYNYIHNYRLYNINAKTLQYCIKKRNITPFNHNGG